MVNLFHKIKRYKICCQLK